MDFWTQLGFTVVLAVIANRKEARKFYPVLAKIYVKIASLAALDSALLSAIQQAEAREVRK